MTSLVHIASDKPCNYHSGSWLLLCRIILSQHALYYENDSSEVSEVDNRLDKIHFADLVKEVKSVAGFSPSRQFRIGRNDVTLGSLSKSLRLVLLRLP